MRALFKTFEEKGRLVKILNACIAGHGVRIIIGHENPDPDLRDLALVTAALPRGRRGGLRARGDGLDAHGIRPRVALVDHVARAVSQARSRSCGHDGDGGRRREG